jgi:hypothetical protein
MIQQEGGREHKHILFLLPLNVDTMSGNNRYLVSGFKQTSFVPLLFDSPYIFTIQRKSSRKIHGLYRLPRDIPTGIPRFSFVEQLRLENVIDEVHPLTLRIFFGFHAHDVVGSCVVNTVYDPITLDFLQQDNNIDIASGIRN